MKNIRLTVLIVIAFLSACTGDQASDQTDKSDRPKTQLEEALSTQIDALESSKQVGQELLDSAEERRREMEDQGR